MMMVVPFLVYSFRSAKEAQDLIDKAKEKGETLPEESRFDSNCITPGTEFMVRLQEALKHFIKSKISNDISWQNCTIILSGHEVNIPSIIRISFHLNSANEC